MRSLDGRIFPPSALIGAGLLIVSSILGVGIYQISAPGHHASLQETTTVVQSRTLRFEDAGDGPGVFGGHVRVFDATTGLELSQLAENEGFVRTVLNGLTFEQTKRKITGPAVFTLAVWSDNKVTLSDPATGARVGLGQFGEKNRAAFMRFLQPSEARP